MSDPANDNDQQQQQPDSPVSSPVDFNEGKWEKTIVILLYVNHIVHILILSL